MRSRKKIQVTRKGFNKYDYEFEYDIFKNLTECQLMIFLGAVLGNTITADREAFNKKIIYEIEVKKIII